MKKLVLFFYLLLASTAVFAQLRLVGVSSGWVTVNDSTYSSTFTRNTDLSGNSYTCNGITTGYRVVSGTAASGIETALKLYRISAVANAFSSTIDLTVVEMDGTQGAPTGQVFVFNPDGRITIPQVPIGSTGATNAMQAAIDTYNSRILADAIAAGSADSIVFSTIYRTDTLAQNLRDEIAGVSVSDGDKGDVDVTASGATWTVDTSAINTIKLADNAVTGAKIAASTIDSTDIATGGVGNTDLAASIVTSSKIADGTVANADLANMAAATIKGSVAGGVPADLSKAQAQGILSVDDLVTLSGVADGAANLGTFTGTTIPDNSTLKASDQALETAVETKLATVTTDGTLTGAGTAGSPLKVDTSQLDVVLENYDSLINYTGNAKIAFVKDFTSTPGWTVKGGVFYRVSTFIGKTVSQAVDYGTRFTDGLGRKWQRNFDGINFYPEFWRVDSTLAYAGTVGWYADGSEAMFQLQSSAANYYFYDAGTGLTEVGETINLTPGKTYESTVQVPMHPYLKINGNGATIVRKAPETTTSADTTLASTAFVIVPAGGTKDFRPNMLISVQRAGDANSGLGENENTGFRAITSLGRANAGNNDTIFVASNWVRGATTGSVVYSGAHPIFTTSGNNRDAGATIRNLNINGNKANHTYSLSWLSGSTFTMPVAKNNLIEGCFFKDIHCENIYIAGGEVRNCSFRDLEGTFSHQSAADTLSLLFQNIKGDSVCLAGTLSGHAGACFETSVGAFGSVTIKDCHVTNGQMRLIGAYSSDDANIFVDNITAMNFQGIHSSNGKLGSFTLQNSLLVNCGDLLLKATNVADTIATVRVANTFFTNSRFQFVKTKNLDFTGNTVSWTPSKFTGYAAGIESLYPSAIAIINLIGDVDMSRNYFWADSTFNSQIASLLYFAINTTTIAGKTVYQGTMSFGDNKVFNFGRLSANSLTSDYDYVGWEFSDNEIWSNPASAQYTGTTGLLNLTRGQKFLRNRVVNQTPAATTYMVTAYGIQSASIDTTTSIGSIMIDNLFEGKGCTYILGSGSWPYNCFAKGNVTRANPIVSNKSSSLDNTVLNSTLLPALTAPSTITRVPYRRPTEPYIKIIR